MLLCYVILAVKDSVYLTEFSVGDITEYLFQCDIHTGSVPFTNIMVGY